MTHKNIDLPIDVYTKLLEYAKHNELKALSSTQGEFVIAAIELLSQAIPTKK